MPGNEHLIQIVIQALLGLAIFSFLEYSIRTAHAPDVVNRRAKLLCAAGLTLSVLGMWVVMYEPLTGMAMTLTGGLVAVGTMIWLESHARKARRRTRKRGGQRVTTESVTTERVTTEDTQQT